MKKLRDDIKKKSMGSLYLFTGEEKHLLKLYENSAINAYLTDKVMNLNVFEGKKTTADSIIDAAETLPFMSEKKIVVVRDSELFIPGRKDESEKISEYIKDFNNDTSILIFEENKVDKRTSAYKSIKKSGQIVEFNPLNENELIIWHSDIIKKRGLTISSKDSAHLIRMCGGDMDSMTRETEKLCTYKTEGKITREDIDLLCSKSLNARIFDLVDAFAKRDVSEALLIYGELLSLKETPVGILALISRQLRLILKCSLLRAKGFGDIAGMLNERPYSVKIALSQVPFFELEVLKNAVIEAVSCDTGIKSGRLNAIVAVELLILKYAN